MLGSIFWPLGVGISLAVLVLLTAAVLVALLFAAIVILGSPFAIARGIRQGIRERREAPSRFDSARSRTRSE